MLFVAITALTLPTVSQAQVAVGVSIHIGPPVLPVYPQPICPGPGYIWTPGYWAYGPYGYYWVPGTWVIAPAVGLLWTPGYWGWGGGVYVWHAGYWGPHVGFYGGINYGYGYGGVGFVGGEWRGGAFAYNTAVTNVNTTVIHNTYVNNTVINRTVVNNNVSYNGGTGGTMAQPTATERAAANERHVAPTTLQTQHAQSASQNHQLLASVNHGQPAVAATSRPGQFNGNGVTAAHAASANVNHPQNSVNGESHTAVRSDRPPYAGQPNHQGQAQTQSSYQHNTNSVNGAQANHAHPNNPASSASHPNNSHPNEHSNPHTTSPHPSGGQPHEKPGR